MQGKQQRQLCHIPDGLTKIHVEVPALRNWHKFTFLSSRLPSTRIAVGQSCRGKTDAEAWNPLGFKVLHTLFLLPWLTWAEVRIQQIFYPGQLLPPSISFYFSIHPHDNQHHHTDTTARSVKFGRHSLPELKLSQVKPLNIVSHAELTLQLLFNSRLQNWDLFRHGCLHDTLEREQGWLSWWWAKGLSRRWVSLG